MKLVASESAAETEQPNRRESSVAGGNWSRACPWAAAALSGVLLTLCFTPLEQAWLVWIALVPLLVAAPCIMVVGLVVQQGFLRWTQGQELRQALITIAVSVIVADQIIAHFPRNVSQGQRFGGNAVDLTWPGWTDRRINLHVWGVEYSLARLVMFGLGVAVGIGLWLWLYRTRTGMVIRAGVDDRHMTESAFVHHQ